MAHPGASGQVLEQPPEQSEGPNDGQGPQVRTGTPNVDRAVRRILVVEDEAEMRGLLRDNLEFEGYEVTASATAEEGLEELSKHATSLVILDLMLPGMSGFEFCRVIRARGLRVPVIVLTARTAESDRIVGLDVGADDYVSKPFSVRELIARVRAQIRREERDSGDRDECVIGETHVNLTRRLVTYRGRRVSLSPREFELLRYLLAHRGEVVTREQLLREVWGYDQAVVTRTVDNYISKLRAHLEPRLNGPTHLITVHGSGYQLL
jgi:DNA-binding response OmpR family regulator